MKKCMILAVMLSLVFFGCSDDDVSGAPDNTATLSAEGESSSSERNAEESSSSIEFHSLCKVSGDWGSRGGCAEISPRGEGDLWSMRDHKVNTRIYMDESAVFGEGAGEFFFETDSAEGGGSEIIWTNSRVILPEFSGLLHANIHLVTGTLPYDPFCNIGFNIAGFDSSGRALTADISAWEGICVIYEGSIVPSIQLDLGDSLNREIGNALPSVKIKSQKGPQCYEWSQFKQATPSDGGVSISGEEAAKKVARVVFHFQEEPDDMHDGYEVIEFIAIGTSRDQPAGLSSSSEQESSSSVTIPPVCAAHENWCYSDMSELRWCLEYGDGCTKECARNDANMWFDGDKQIYPAIDDIDEFLKIGVGFREFFFETDSVEGGKSRIELDNGTSRSPEFSGFLRGAIQLDKGDLPGNPYADIVFYTAGGDSSSGKANTIDISDWEGLCVYYQGTMRPTIQLDLGDSINKEIGYALPSVKIYSRPKSQCFGWEQFEQLDRDENAKIISGEEASKNVARIIFHFQKKPNADTEGYECFEFIAIGTIANYI